MLVQYRFVFLFHLGRIALKVRRPFARGAIELEFGTLKRDVWIEPRT